MESVEQHILGSAEPLTPVQREARLRELAEWGVDLSLSYAQLHKSPDERLDEWLAMYAFAQEATRARAAGRIFPRRPGHRHTSNADKTFDGIS